MSSRIVHSTQVLTRLPFSIPKALVEVRLVIVVYPFLWTEVVAYSQKHYCCFILKSRPLRIISVEFFKVTFMVVPNFWLTTFWLYIFLKKTGEQLSSLIWRQEDGPTILNTLAYRMRRSFGSVFGIEFFSTIDFPVSFSCLWATSFQLQCEHL